MAETQLRYAVLQDGGKFLYDPESEALPTHVNDVPVGGSVPGPVVELPDDYTWKTRMMLVGQALTAARTPAADDPASDPEPAYVPPASHFQVGPPAGLGGDR